MCTYISINMYALYRELHDYILTTYKIMLKDNQVIQHIIHKIKLPCIIQRAATLWEFWFHKDKRVCLWDKRSGYHIRGYDSFNLA